MKEQKVSVTFFLDKSRPNTENKCLVKLNIYCRPNKKRYATTYHVTEEEWEKLNNSNLRDDSLKEIKKKLNNLQTAVENVVDKIVPFSFIAFEEIYFEKVTRPGAKSTSLQSWFNAYVDELNEKDQVGTATVYRTTINSINDFKKGLHLQDITPSLLKNYEKHLTDQGKSYTTVSIYLRSLRAIINQAIDAKVLSAENYPFRNYEIPSGRNIKKALSEIDIQKLLNYAPVNADEKKALDFWILSYLCSGINFADIITLKPSNITGDYLHFVRVKTKNTKKKDLRPIKVGLHSRAKEIINNWKNTNPDNPYLFPVLEAGITAKTAKHRCQRFIKWVNKRMEAIRIELKIEQKVRTYEARHTFSTILKRKGISTEIIKESLGHSSLAVTENYLDSFADDVKLKTANILTEFS